MKFTLGGDIGDSGNKADDITQDGADIRKRCIMVQEGGRDELCNPAKEDQRMRGGGTRTGGFWSFGAPRGMPSADV